jgi:hypothetical protein
MFLLQAGSLNSFGSFISEQAEELQSQSLIDKILPFIIILLGIVIVMGCIRLIIKWIKEK